MPLLVRIQGHPSRAHLHQPLVEAVGLPAEVMLHASDPPNPWAGYKRCLSEIPGNVKHVCVLQDDVEVAHNFAPAVEQIASSNPDTPVCLFLARLPRRTSMYATQALKRGERYSEVWFHDFVPACGIVWPVAKAREFMEWADGRRLPGNPNPRSDDAVLGFWMRQTKQRILVTCPSIVQHPDREPSLIGKRAAWGKDSGRVALHFAEDALNYLW